MMLLKGSSVGEKNKEEKSYDGKNGKRISDFSDGISIGDTIFFCSISL